MVNNLTIAAKKSPATEIAGAVPSDLFFKSELDLHCRIRRRNRFGGFFKLAEAGRIVGVILFELLEFTLSVLLRLRFDFVVQIFLSVFAIVLVFAVFKYADRRCGE